MKNLSYTTFVVFFILIFQPLVGSCEEPSYNGKRLNEWVNSLGRTNALRDQAQNAILDMGTNALPFLVEDLRALGELWKKEGTNFFNIPANMNRTLEIRTAFETLGPIAKPAVPALIDLINEGKVSSIAAYDLVKIDPEIAPFVFTQALTNQSIVARIAAANYLFYVRSNAAMAVPNLIQCLKDDSTNMEASSELRGYSALALGFIGSDSEKAVPALVKALQRDKDPRVRGSAAQALGKFEKQAEIAVPILLKISTNDPSHHVRNDAVIALKKIQSP